MVETFQRACIDPRLFPKSNFGLEISITHTGEYIFLCFIFICDFEESIVMKCFVKGCQINRTLVQSFILGAVAGRRSYRDRRRRRNVEILERFFENHVSQRKQKCFEFIYRRAVNKMHDIYIGVIFVMFIQFNNLTRFRLYFFNSLNIYIGTSLIYISVLYLLYFFFYRINVIFLRECKYKLDVIVEFTFIGLNFY